MLHGLYTAASGIMMQERNINVLTNNMANAQTPGFRASRVVATTFEQELLTRLEGSNTGRIGVGAPVRVVEEVPTRFDRSLLQETGRPYDFAIDGEGFFNIGTVVDTEGIDLGESQDPQRYLTRNGNFDIDEEGYLILRGVGRVLGERGEIRLGNENFTVEPDGMIYNERGRRVDRLLVTLPEAEARLLPNQNGLYVLEDWEQNTTLSDVHIVQGWTERSNVDFNREYTLVMEAQRAFQANSSALQILDRINQKAATGIASL